MQQRCAIDQPDALLTEAHSGRDLHCRFRHAQRVPVGERGFGVNDIGEGLADEVDVRRLQAMDLLGGKIESGASGFDFRGAGEGMFPEEACVVEMLRQGDKLRIEPASRTIAQGPHGALGPLFGCENVKVLRDGKNAGFKRNRVADTALRIPASVPMLVEPAHGFCRYVSEAEFAQDIGAAIAAELDDFLVVAVLGEADAHDAGNAVERTRFRKDGAPQQSQRRSFRAAGTGPVLQLDAGFDLALVAAADDLAQTGGIAAAAHVFQKQGIVEAGRAILRKTKLPGQAHAENATAQSVTRHSTLGEVKREGERGENLGQ